MPAAKVRSARVAVTRVDPEVWVSPDPGEIVERATGDERKKALYVDEMGRPLARRALGRDGAPVHVDLDFFDGRKGGHMSISGISGVATKTSFALFFLRMLTAREHAGIVGEGAAIAARAGVQREGRGPAVARHAQPPVRRGRAGGLGRARGGAVPVPERQVLGTAQRRSGDVVLPDTGGRQEGVDVFTWTPREFIDEDLLQFCFTDANDATQPAPVRPRTRAGPAQALRRGRGGSARRRGAARPASYAARARRAGAGGARRARDLGPRLARRTPRRVPRAGGRLRARSRLERAGDGRHGLRVHAQAARRLVAVRSPRAGGTVAPHRPRRAPA